jgi:ATP-dependent protease Clp ATPase subunit
MVRSGIQPVCICNECLDVCRKILDDDSKHPEKFGTTQAASCAAGSLACGFCGRSQEVVDKLVSAPAGHKPCYICDNCVSEGTHKLAADDMARKESLFKRLTRAFRSNQAGRISARTQE